jgi:hypothetical protein
MRLACQVTCMGQMRNLRKILVGNPEEKKPLGRTRSRWVDNIKMDLRQIVWEGVDCIHMAQDRDQRRTLANMIMNLWVL